MALETLMVMLLADQGAERQQEPISFSLSDSDEKTST